MQKKKEEIRKLILKVAKEEFLKCGYEKASLRNIGREVGMSHGNIMVYFRNKEELFGSWVKRRAPAL